MPAKRRRPATGDEAHGSPHHIGEKCLGYCPVSGAFTDEGLTEHNLPYLGIIGTQAKST